MAEATESELYMWRAIVAMAHADNVVTPEEIVFMKEMVKGSGLSREQRLVLENDLKNPRDISEMFFAISNPQDRNRFFRYARMLCWCDGDFDQQEQTIITALQRDQAMNIDLSHFRDNQAIDLGFELELDDFQQRKMQKEYDHLHEPKKRGFFASLFGRSE